MYYPFCRKFYHLYLYHLFKTVCNKVNLFEVLQKESVDCQIVLTEDWSCCNIIVTWSLLNVSFVVTWGKFIIWRGYSKFEKAVKWSVCIHYMLYDFVCLPACLLSVIMDPRILWINVLNTLWKQNKTKKYRGITFLH